MDGIIHLIRLVVIIFLVWQAFMVLVFRFRPRPAVDWLRSFNKWILNPAMLTLAGRRHWYASVVRHVGRRSGRPYATPVVAEATVDGFLIPLPYGADVDWCRNVLAARGCVIQRNGFTYTVDQPEVVDRAAGLPMLPPARQAVFRLYGVKQFLRVRRLSESHDGSAVREIARRGGGMIGGHRSLLAVAWDAWRAVRGGPPAILARQQARLSDLVAFARTCSPYYRNLYRRLPADVADLRQLPPVTKRELMAHFDDWVTDPAITRAGVEAFVADLSGVGQLYLGRYLIWTTSGTTGVPALLVQDRDSLAVIDAIRVRALPGWVRPRDVWEILRRGYRIAVLFATGGHFGGISLAEWVLRSRPYLKNRARIFSVQTPLRELVRELNAFQPAVISGYATALALLAQEQEAGRLHIHPILVMSTAESLTPTMRQHIEAALGCRLRDAYGASEAGAIAFGCDRGWLHVNADWYIVEPVDEQYRPATPGEPSHSVLVTNLANRVQPIIRYDLGDSVTLKADPCPCGSPLPAMRVEGRTDEILSFPAATGQAVHVLPLALGTVVEETPGVRRFQAIQTGPASLVVRLEVASAAEQEAVWQRVKQRLHIYLEAQGLPAVSVARAAEPPTRDPRTGKFRHVWAEPKAWESGGHRE